MSKIVQYFIRDGAKTYDVKQALRDSGWGIAIGDLENVTELALVSRFDSEHKVTVSSITHDLLMRMWFVHYEAGGWQCLDNAIDQFEPITAEKA